MRKEEWLWGLPGGCGEGNTGKNDVPYKWTWPGDEHHTSGSQLF